MSPGWQDTFLDAVMAPGLWLGVVLGVFYAMLFALWHGGSLRQAPRDLIASLLGFGVGHLGASLLGLTWLRFGELQLLSGTVGAWLALWLRRRLF